ncbi:MAG: hypothetical protein KAX31_05515, partial [Thermoplasmata archaeon]|nr:hypothetical protein [Thermoplasmata archaeon]
MISKKPRTVSIGYKKLLTTLLSLLIVLSSQLAGCAAFINGDADQITLASDVPSMVTLSLVEPKGGETWRGGDVREIIWEISDDSDIRRNSIDISYSIDNGAAWTRIAEDEPNDGIFSWTLPFLTSDDCLVKVSALDALGRISFEVCDSAFSIDSTKPFIQVQTPNGRVVWKGGSTEHIDWTMTDNRQAPQTPIDIHYSKDGGQHWMLIARDVPNLGTYMLTAPLVSSQDCLVRVDAIDAAGNLNHDRSDRFFTIDSIVPFVQVTSLSGSAFIGGGERCEITWTAYDNFNLGLDPVSIFYTTDDGENWVSIAENEPNDGAYTWTAPFEHSAECLVKVEVIDAAGNVGGDLGVERIIVYDTEAPSTLNLLAPTQLAFIPSSTTMTAGTQYTFTIQAQNGTGSPENVAVDTLVQLSTTSSVGEFRQVGTSDPITQITILALTSSVQVDYYDEDVANGPYTLTANNTGLSNGIATVTVEPGAVDTIIVTPNPAMVVVGTQQQFNATAYDAFGNE